MANALIANISPEAFFPGVGGHPTFPVSQNLGKGLAFGVNLPQPFLAVPETAYACFWVPAVAGLATGLTTELLLADDPFNPGPGLLATFDVSYALVVSGTTLEADASFTGTVDSVQVTMPTGTTGKLKTAVITTILAHIAGTAAVNTWMIVRLRRKPAASDTHLGRIIVRQVTVIDT